MKSFSKTDEESKVTKVHLYKIFITMMITLLALVVVFTFVACQDKDQHEDHVVLSSIELVEGNIEPIYFQGDTLPTNLKIKANYSDGSSEIINVSEDMISGFDDEIEGEKDVKITYGGVELKFTITLYKAIKEINLDTSSIDKEYAVGEQFNFTNAKLKISHNDESVTDISVTSAMLVDFSTEIAGNLKCQIKFRDKTFNINYIVTGTFELNDFQITFDFDSEKYSVNAYVGNSADVVIPSLINDCQIEFIAPKIFGTKIIDIKNLTIPFIGATPEYDENFIRTYGKPHFNYLYDKEAIGILLEEGISYVIYSQIAVTLLPGYITEIPESAFLSEYLVGSLILPDTITEICDYAFQGSLISNIQLPQALKVIGDDAFSQASFIRYIDLPDSLEEIGEHAFSSFYSSVLIKVPSQPIEKLGNYALSGVRGIIIPEGSSAAYANSEVWNSYSDLFHNASDIEIIDDAFLIESATNEKILLGYIKYESEIILPSDITQIAEYAFHYNIRLKSIILPDTLKKIDNYAFFYTAIESIIIPNSVTEIGKYALYAPYLKILTIPESVTSLGSDFFGFRGSKLIMESKTPPTLNGYCDASIILVPNDATKEYRNQWNNYADKIFPVSDINSYFYIKNDVLEYYSGEDKNVEIPEGVAAIGTSAFAYSTVESITIPSTVHTIKSSAFYSATNLITVRIAEDSQLETIERSAFSACKNLTTFDWVDSIKTIGHGAFEDTGITEVFFSTTSQLEIIETYAFRYCSSLNDVEILSTSLTQIGEMVFYESNNIIVIKMKMLELEISNINYRWNQKGYNNSEIIFHEVEWGFIS
ncbi:MAG: leucine-rich repeat protein [Christensenellaceae bacterium]|nr:leucine-rich repeat protein [Christensenellaceae bacterium]